MSPERMTGGVISIAIEAEGQTIDLDHDVTTIDDLREEIEWFETQYEEDAETSLMKQELRAAIERAFLHYKLLFIRQHGLTADEFDDPVNQVLFHIQYPDAR